MADLGGFDASKVDPNAGFPVLPAGDYDVVLVKSDKKATKDGNGAYLNLEFQILSGPHQNQRLFEMLNLWNKSEKAVQIARGTLSEICRAVGVLTPKDSSELHGKPLRAKVVITKSDQYGDQNKIKSYKPRNGELQTAGTATQGNGRPW